MSNLDSRQAEYNKFTNLPLLAYNCVSYLMDNDELIWKLIYYTTDDAWNKTNLTIDQKRGLIYRGEPDETLFRVFLDSGQNNAWTVEACVIRISCLELLPMNYIHGQVTMAFEVYSHYKINHLNNYQTRMDTITQRFLEVFNGADIEGIGRLYFDRRASGENRSRIIGQSPYKGRVTLMGNRILG